MTEICRPNWDDTFIWTGAVWDAAFRAMLAEISNGFAWASKHETDSGSGVVGGFAWANPSGLTTRIGRGLGMIYDAAIASPGPKWKWCPSSADLDGTHSARHATLDRVDAVSLSFALVEGVSQTLGRSGGAAPAATNTQARSVATLVITAGTPHASAWANKASMPAGNLPLYYVIVPSTADGGAISAIDARSFLPGPKNRPATAPMTSQTDVDTDANMLEVSARAADDVDTAFLSSLRWDVTNDRPYVIRGKTSETAYPLLAKDGASKRSIALGAGGSVDYGSGSSTDLAIRHLMSHAKLLRGSSGACAGSLSWSVPVDLRSLRLVGLDVTVKLVAAFTGSVTLTFDLYKQDATGTDTLIGSAALNGISTGSWVTLTDTDFGPLTEGVVDDDESLVARVNWSLSGGGAGELHVKMARFSFSEN